MSPASAVHSLFDSNENTAELDVNKFKFLCIYNCVMVNLYKCSVIQVKLFTTRKFKRNTILKKCLRAQHNFLEFPLWKNHLFFLCIEMSRITTIHLILGNCTM